MESMGRPVQDFSSLRVLFFSSLCVLRGDHSNVDFQPVDEILFNPRGPRRATFSLFFFFFLGTFFSFDVAAISRSSARLLCHTRFFFPRLPILVDSLVRSPPLTPQTIGSVFFPPCVSSVFPVQFPFFSAIYFCIPDWPDLEWVSRGWVYPLSFVFFVVSPVLPQHSAPFFRAFYFCAMKPTHLSPFILCFHLLGYFSRLGDQLFPPPLVTFFSGPLEASLPSPSTPVITLFSVPERKTPIIH